MQVMTAKLQSRGYLTLPASIRQLLKVKEGEEVSFVVRDNGDIVLCSTLALLNKAIEVDAFFEETGILFDEWKKDGAAIRAKLFKEMYPDIAEIPNQ